MTMVPTNKKKVVENKPSGRRELKLKFIMPPEEETTEAQLEELDPLPESGYSTSGLKLTFKASFGATKATTTSANTSSVVSTETNSATNTFTTISTATSTTASTTNATEHIDSKRARYGDSPSSTVAAQLERATLSSATKLPQLK